MEEYSTDEEEEEEPVKKDIIPVDPVNHLILQSLNWAVSIRSIHTEATSNVSLTNLSR